MNRNNPIEWRSLMLSKQSDILKLNERWHWNIIPTRLQCAGCLAEAKHPKQVPVCKSVKSLVWHLGTQHKGEFWVNDCKEVLKVISLALDSGIICHD